MEKGWSSGACTKGVHRKFPHEHLYYRRKKTMDLMKNFIEKNMPEKAAPDVTVGDTVRVHLRVKEGNRERIQVFEGRSSGQEARAASTRPSPCAGSPMASVWRRCSLFTALSLRRWRPSGKVRSAGPSCTICATAWARRQRSRRSCNSNEFPKRGALPALPFLLDAGPPGKPGSRGVFPGGSPLFCGKAFSERGKSCILISYEITPFQGGQLPRQGRERIGT